MTSPKRAKKMKIEKLIEKLEQGAPLQKAELKAAIHFLKDYQYLIMRLEGRWDEVKKHAQNS